MKYFYVKRFFDIIFSSVLLLLMCLPMLMIYVGVILYDGFPGIFKQERIGLNGKRFICYKFRTMRIDAPKNLSTEEFYNADNFITPIGAFLRRTSLDELPQLFNVFLGEMSIVGPRPLIPHEKSVHDKRMVFSVYSVRPGITGLAQICGRDDLPSEKKVECDAIYVENLSLISPSFNKMSKSPAFFIDILTSC